jgi:hypothetical protein
VTVRREWRARIRSASSAVGSPGGRGLRSLAAAGAAWIGLCVGLACVVEALSCGRRGWRWLDERVAVAQNSRHARMQSARAPRRGVSNLIRVQSTIAAGRYYFALLCTERGRARALRAATKA